VKKSFLSLSVVLFAASTALRAQNPMTAEATGLYKTVSANILKAAEKMPDADYGFKPAAESRNFGQLIAHVADAQMALCGAAKGEMKRGDAAKKTSKAELVAALKASSEFCDNAYSRMTDAEGAIIVDSKTQLGNKSKIGLLN
jgi:DinB superfamily